MTNLNTFSVSSNLFPSIDVSNNPNLTDLRIQIFVIGIDVSNNPNLSTLMVGSTNLNSLNISNNKVFYQFHLINNYCFFGIQAICS